MARCIVIALLFAILAACGQPVADDAAGSTGQDDTAGSLATVPVDVQTPPASATVDLGIDVESEQMIAAALAYLDWREAVRTGQPDPRLAVPGTPSSIQELGLSIGNWDPGCVRPMYLVILQGDFDGDNLFVSPGGDSELTGAYLALVFDLSTGVPGVVTFTILS